MDDIGFFTDKDNKIIASNIEIKETVIADLVDALAFLEEVTKYYENRLDLLTTSIVWGMIAPAVFMLKTNNYFLKWFHFYGFLIDIALQTASTKQIKTAAAATEADFFKET